MYLELSYNNSSDIHAFSELESSCINCDRLILPATLSYILASHTICTGIDVSSGVRDGVATIAITPRSVVDCAEVVGLQLCDADCSTLSIDVLRSAAYESSVVSAKC